MDRATDLRLYRMALRRQQLLGQINGKEPNIHRVLSDLSWSWDQKSEPQKEKEWRSFQTTMKRLNSE